MKAVYGVLLFVGMAFTACQSQTTHEPIEALDFSELISYDNHAIIFDVRTPAEYNEGHIPGAKNMDYYDDAFEAKLKKLDKNKSYFVYCAVGGRSGSAATLMFEHEFKKVHDLKGGMGAWETAGLPITTD